MNENSTLNKIFNGVKAGKIDKERAGNLLLSIIEESNKASIRIYVLKILDLMELKLPKIFRVLENLLISDENPRVRKLAAKIIIKLYFKEGFESLKWNLNHDSAPLVIKAIFDSADKFLGNSAIEREFYEELVDWLNTFSSQVGVVPEEARFFLDLEALFSKNKQNAKFSFEIYNFCQTMTNLLNDGPWLVIKDKHVIRLTFNRESWKYLKEMEGSFNSLLNISYLDLYFSYLLKRNLYPVKPFKIPNSIGMLRCLEYLDLSHNNLNTLPESLRNLQILDQIILKNNKFQEFPPEILILKNLRVLDLSQNKIREIPNLSQNFPLLEDINLSYNEIKKYPPWMDEETMKFRLYLENNPL